MKYDILVQTFTSSLVRKQYLRKKIAIFSTKIGEEKNLSKSVSGYYKTKKKKKKKWHGPLSHWCREGKTLVVRPLKKNTFFMCVFPYLDYKYKCLDGSIFHFPNQKSLYLLN